MAHRVRKIKITLIFSRPYLRNGRAYGTVVICRPSVCLSQMYCG